MRNLILIVLIFISVQSFGQLNRSELKRVNIGYLWAPIDTVTKYVVEPVENDSIREWLKIPEERPQDKARQGEISLGDTIGVWKRDFRYAVWESRKVTLHQRMLLYRNDTVLLSKRERLIKALRIGMNKNVSNQQFWNYVENNQ